MEKYYCLLLNRCYDIGNHYGSIEVSTRIPDVLEKKCRTLENIEDEFMCLDDTIVLTGKSYTIYGSFPVFAQMRDGKMYDAVDGRLIEFTEDGKTVNGLSYSKKCVADQRIAQMMLASLDEESKKRYSAYLDMLTVRAKRIYSGEDLFEGFYVIKLCDETSYPLIAIKIDGDFIDIITREKIYPAKENSITSHLSFTELTDVLEFYSDPSNAKTFNSNLSSPEETLKFVDKHGEVIRTAKTTAIREYNNFVTFNKDKPAPVSPKTRKKEPNKK